MSGGRSTAVREIKSRLSILDIVRRYVELRNMGSRWVAPCPFHQETKPSFSVNEEEGFFYCFGCQAAGDIFDFYSRINGLDFKETLTQLAQEAGITLGGSYKVDPKATKEKSKKTAALQMYTHASSFYKKNLSAPTGVTCREYLAQRKLSDETIESFGLGWSTDAWQGLTTSLEKTGFILQDAIEAGLLSKSAKSGRLFDRFRLRLMFPIKNLSGQVIAFGGRIIADEDAAKYINSSDSILYKKGDNLYGLFEARRAISVKKSVFLTEGYMDVLTLHQFGYTNSCGVLGTALTDEQVRRLSGFCSNFELVFDGDGPGEKAALRAVEMFLSKGLRCKVILLPEKKDIDDVLQKDGKEAFEEMRTFAPDGLDFCIRTLSIQYAPKDILEWVRSFVAKVEQPELLTRYVSRLSQTLDFDESEIRGIVAERSQQTQGNQRHTSLRNEVSTNAMSKNALDREILKFVVRFPHHLPSLASAGAVLLLTEDWAISLWEKIATCQPDFSSDSVLQILDDKEKGFWGQYRVMQKIPQETEQIELRDICATIRKKCLERQEAACVLAMRQNVGAGANTDLELLRAVNETLAQRRALGSTDGKH